MIKFFKSQYFEDKSASKYSVFLLSNHFLKEIMKKALSIFFVKALCLSQFIQLVYPNLGLKTLR